MSIMYAVSIEARCRVSGKVEKLNAMVKTMPRNQARVTMLNDTQAFPKEVKMYQTVFPSLIKFQEERGVEEGAIFAPWAKSYASLLSSDGKDDYIALQDLRDEQ